MLTKIRQAQFLFLLAAISLPGCSDSAEEHPPLYPVKGRVIRDGNPMPTGTIIFEYDGHGPDAPKGAAGGPFRATAKINDGGFSMNGYAGVQGMPAGNYKVGVLPLQGRSEKGIFDREIVLPKKGKSDVAKGRFADPKTSGLNAQVTKDSPNEPVIELK